MANKFINTRLEGLYKTRGKIYVVEIEKKTTAEIINFYTTKQEEDKLEKDMLISSIFTKYLSRAVGVKKAGEFQREVFGDFDIYINFQKTLENIRNNKNDIEANKKLILSEKLGFVDIIERKTDILYHKQLFSEGNLLEEIAEEYKETEDGKELIYRIEYTCKAKGREVKANKIKGIEYKIREKGNSDIRTLQIKTLDMIALEKDLTWVRDKNYKILTTNEEFEEYLQRIHNLKDDIIGFDTETTGLNINRFPVEHPQRDTLVGICLSIEDNEGVYIPVGHKLFDNLDEEYVIERLRPYLCSDGIYKKPIVTHYGSFDWKVMWTYGIKLNITHDTYLLQYMLNNSQFKEGKSLGELARKELNMDMIDLDDMFIKVRGRKTKIDFSMLPFESVRHYAPADADATRLLYKIKQPQLPNSMEFLYWVEVELMKYLAKIEYYGIKLDIPMLVRQLEIAKSKKKELEEKIYKFVGRKFKINSTKELPQILYEELKYPALSFTDKGKPSTGVVALNLLSEERDKNGNLKYELAKLLLDYRGQEKLINGFLNKMLNENIDGYIFPSYNQTGTTSGRISCSGPNIQQSPGKQREVFITDSDDYYFVIVDYSQIEYRVMAGLANEIDVIKSFEDPETDHHVGMYSRMFGVKQEDVTSKMRKLGKQINFGVTYGMGPASLAYTLFNDRSRDKVQEASKLTDKYFDAVPNIRDMLREAKDRAFAFGYIETKFGRRRYFPDIRHKENYIRTTNMRRAANTKVQGTAADILKIAHVKVERELEKRNLDCQVKISMHDELVLQVSKKISPWKIIKLLRENMEIKIKGFPTLFIGSNVGNTWAAGKRDDLEIPIALTEEMFKKGEHEKDTWHENPQEEVEKQIKDFVVRQLKQIIIDRNLDTVEKAMEFPKVEKLVKDYFNMDTEVIENILNGKDVQLKLNTEVKYNDYHIKYGEEGIDDDEGIKEVERVNEAALTRLHETDKNRLVLDSPEIRNALKYYKTDYRVMIHDKKCFIRVDGTTGGVIRELKEYLDEVGDVVGNTVVIENNGRLHETKYKLNTVDKFKILMILDKYRAKFNISEVVDKIS